MDNSPRYGEYYDSVKEDGSLIINPDSALNLTNKGHAASHNLVTETPLHTLMSISDSVEVINRNLETLGIQNDAVKTAALNKFKTTLENAIQEFRDALIENDVQAVPEKLTFMNV